MFEVVFSFDLEEWYTYGTYSDPTRANEVAMYVRDSRDCYAEVHEV